jgi:hypothetical protein
MERMSLRIPSLNIFWRGNVLCIQGERLRVAQINVTYLEAFCRAESHDREWNETVIPHETILLAEEDGGTRLRMESKISDGTTVSHVLTAGKDEITFDLTAHNPTDKQDFPEKVG